MARFSVFIVWFAVLFLTGCSSDNGIEWHQKLTVTVEIDGKEYVGSSVSKMRARSAGALAQGSRGVSDYEDIEGEAVVIDMGPQGYLFALWKYQDPGYWARILRKGPQSTGDQARDKQQNEKFQQNDGIYKRQLLLNPGKIPESETDYPLLVAFENIADPKTIQTFTKEFHWEKRDRSAWVFDAVAFARFYGEGAKIKSVVFENTDDPVTVGVLNSILSELYFDEWHKARRSYGLSIDCVRKSPNRKFCDLHKGMWLQKFPISK